MTILHIDASARRNNSSTRKMSQEVVNTLGHEKVIRRDISEGLPFVTEDWVNANFTDEADHDDHQRAVLAKSDELIDELIRADIIVIGVPIYNFGIPSTLKAWVDLVARARKTFKYTENGPVGLLENKTTYLTFASDGTAIGSDIDFASNYMKHIMGFIGITDVKIFAAGQQMTLGDEPVNAALNNITKI